MSGGIAYVYDVKAKFRDHCATKKWLILMNVDRKMKNYLMI